MNPAPRLSLLGALLLLTPPAAAQTEASAVSAAAAAPAAVAFEPHATVWEYQTREPQPEGGERIATHRYTQIETGLNYQDPSGAWHPSTPRIELLGHHAVFRQGQFQVLCADNVAAPVMAELWTPEGLVLKSRLFGLAYYDPATSQSVLIAELQEAVGELQPAQDEIVYADAFTDLAADVVLTVRKSGFEQNVVLRERPPDPQAYGLGRDSVLMLLTEFVDPPTPAERVLEPAPMTDAVTNRVEGTGALGVEARLSFGSMQLGKGQAFETDDRNIQVPIQKTWQTVEGVQFLIEWVPVAALEPLLERLPDAKTAAAAGQGRDLKAYVQAHRQNSRVAALGSEPLRWAMVSTRRPGCVLDYYAELTSAADVTLRSDGTYLVTGPCTLTGSTVIEGGVVVKFANTGSPQLKIQGRLECRTSAARPALFTSKDDNTAGTVIPGSTGSPSGFYASTALWLDDNLSSLKHVRIQRAGRAIYYDSDTGWPHELWHAQITHCGYGVMSGSPEFRARNVLFENVTTNFHATVSGVVGRLEHLTSHTGTRLRGNANLTLYATNSLLVGLTYTDGYSGAGNATDSNGAFQTVLGGRHYLANGSVHRDIGTTNIAYDLRLDLMELTTHPPLPLSGSVTVNTILSPQAPRDTDTPDRGYHYPALDWTLSALAVNGATLTLTNGVAVGVYGTDGLKLQSGAKLVSEGPATRLNRLGPCRAAQEDDGATLGTMAGAVIKDDLTSGTWPEVRLRFTESVLLGGAGSHFDGGKQTALVELRDCQVVGGAWKLKKTGVSALTVNFHNNLWERVFVELLEDGGVSRNVACYNNTFLGGTVAFGRDSTGGTWTVRDNAFVQTALSQAAQFAAANHSYNGYINGSTRLTPNQSSDRVLTAVPAWQNGPLGRYYYPTGLSWIDADSGRTPATAGLYHHTTLATQSKEAATALDLGFHYVAATGAEVEVAKSGMTLSGSGTCYGWAYANAKNDLWTDPGWCNCTYTGTSEYLRVDLGSTRAVGRVSYVPRVMSGNWTDGSHNGLYRRFDLHVTDSSSGNPADWGAAVASGEWYWPARQERREVVFTPKNGRYVYFRRVTAWGWYSAQDPNYAQYGYPGFANANEIWVYQRQANQVVALDYDGDSLPDHVEDRDGDGIVDPGETAAGNADTDGDGLSDAAEPWATDTDPLDADSDNNGIPDGDESSGEPKVYLASYNLRSTTRDYTALARAQVYSDAACRLGWRREVGGWMHEMQDRSECDPLPEAVVSGTDYYWTAEGDGVRIDWHDGVYEAPCPYVGLLEGDFLWEKCASAAEYSPPPVGLGGTYARTADCAVKLYTGAKRNAVSRPFYVTCTAVDKGSVAEVMDFDGECWLAEPKTAWYGDPIVPSAISIRGQALAADGTVVLTLPADSIVDLTPTIRDPQDPSRYEWYAFTLGAEAIRVGSVEWEALPGNEPLKDQEDGGKRIIPDKLGPTDLDPGRRKRVRARAVITVAVPNVTVFFRGFDVDDTSSDPVIDPNGSAGGDNLGGNLTPTSANAPTDANGIAMVEFTVARNPGDNFKVIAACDTGQVEAVSQGQVDASAVPTPVKVTPMLTVWRRLRVELDSMGSEPPNFAFDGDDLLRGDVPDPDVSAFAGALDPCYIEVDRTTLAPYDSPQLPWAHHLSTLEDTESFAGVAHGCTSSPDYWCVQAIGAYEDYLQDRDNDLDPAEGGLCGRGGLHPVRGPYWYIYHETVRDVAAQHGASQTVLGQVVALHELGEHLGLEHNDQEPPVSAMWAPEGDEAREHYVTDVVPYFTPSEIREIRSLESSDFE